jgi:HPr kinase/phosphorylase
MAGRALARVQMHGTTIALKPDESEGWVAAIIRGPSGSGKSDLALRCLAHPLGPLFPGAVVQSGIRLVADDQTVLSAENQGAHVIVNASSPRSIAGLMEVRGLGILNVPHIATAELILVVDLVPSGDVPRLPTPGNIMIDLVQTDARGEQARFVALLPHVKLTPFEHASPIKLLLALIRTSRTGSPIFADAAKHHCLPEGQ